MKVNAYILAADPAWIEASVLSYYEHVEQIVVSYDEDGRGWSGEPIAVDECLRRLRAIDCKSKLRLSPGRYAASGRPAMHSDTHQRQCALAEAGVGADWVLQLDTDEALPDVGEFVSCLEQAHRAGWRSMMYPFRFLYTCVRPGLYLEQSTRLWCCSTSYPGPVAVRPGTRLRWARQCEDPSFRVDVNSCRRRAAAAGQVVHRTIKPGQALFHFSWVRSEADMLFKSRSSGHAQDFDWSPRLQDWMWCGRHPWLAVARSPMLGQRAGSAAIRLRPVRFRALHVDPNDFHVSAGRGTGASEGSDDVASERVACADKAAEARARG